MIQSEKFGGCTCCGDLLAQRFDRRHVLRAAGGLAAFAALQPFMALAAEGNYEAMVLGCIDPRLQEPVSKYTAARGLTGKYSQFVIAGAAIGAVAEPFKDWHKAFWDNLATSVQPRSPMARRKSRPARSRPRPIVRRWPSSAAKWANASRSLPSRPA